LVGLEPGFTEAKEMITRLIQSVEKTQLIKMDEVKKEYIKTFATAIGLSKFWKEVDMETEHADGIYLSGKQGILQESKQCKIYVFFSFENRSLLQKIIYQMLE